MVKNIYKSDFKCLIMKYIGIIDANINVCASGYANLKKIMVKNSYRIELRMQMERKASVVDIILSEIHRA